MSSVMQIQSNNKHVIVERQAPIGPPLKWLRTNPIWKWLVSRVGGPVYRVFWEYLLNFVGKLLYFRYGYWKHRDSELERRAVKIVGNSAKFKAFAADLRRQFDPLMIAREREKLLAECHERAYVVNLFRLMNQETRRAILEFALDPEVLQYAIGYMKVVPRLGEPVVLLNVARGDLPEEGSKQWHRDEFDYKNFTLFMCLSDVDETSGPYHVIGRELLPFHAHIPKTVDPSRSPWTRYRLSDEEVFVYIRPSHVQKLIGPPGTTSMQNSSTCYHKGGFCAGRERLMLQLCYQTDDATSPVLPVDTWLDVGDPAVARLLGDPVRGFVAGRSQRAIPRILRRLRVYGILRRIYWKLLVYYARPLPA